MARIGEMRASATMLPRVAPPTRPIADSTSVQMPASARYSTWWKEKVWNIASARNPAIAEARMADDGEDRFEDGGQHDIDRRDDEIGFERAEGEALHVVGRRGELGHRDGGDDARGEHDQDELAGERGVH